MTLIRQVFSAYSNMSWRMVAAACSAVPQAVHVYALAEV